LLTAPTLGPDSAAMGAGRLLGREAELAAVLDAVAEGVPLVLVTGDAGIGKSRLVAQAVSDARARGVVVLAGGCVALSGKLPLLPFVEALAGMDQTVAAAAVDRVPASLRPALRAVMPTGEEGAFGGSGRPGEEHGEHAGWERERLVLAVAALLSPPARVSPTVVVLEDLHWADPFTVDLLTYLVAGTVTGATCVVTLRTDQRPLQESVLVAVGELQRLDSTVTVELGPLPPGVVAQQVQDVLGQEPSPGLVERVVELGGGNPFFTEQLCRHIETADPLGTGGVAVLPPRLLGFLQSRLRGLSDPARRALLVLGVAGVPLSVSQLSAAAVLTGSDTASAVRELSDAALLVRSDRARLAPRHALLSAAIVEVSDPASVAQAHAGVAALLEASGDPSAAVAAAGHWAEAGRDSDELRATLVAAPVAEDLAGFDTAATLWSRAYTLAQAFPDVAAACGHSLLSVAVSALKALNWAGRNEDAHVLAEDALQRLSPVEETPMGGSLRYWVGLFRSMRDLTAGTEMLREAERVLSLHPPTSHLVASVVRLGQLEEASGRPEPALALLTRACEGAREAGVLQDEAHATVALAHVMFGVGRADDAIAVVADFGRRPEIAEDVRAQGLLAVLESDFLLQTGKLAKARTVAWDAYELMSREGHGGTWEVSLLRYNAGEAELELGFSVQTRTLVELVTTGRTPNIDTTGDHVLRALADLNIGRLTEAVHRVENVSAVSRATAFTEDIRITAAALATILRWAGQPQQALEAVEQDLALLGGTDQERRCGELLVCGAAAAADLATGVRARGDAEMLARVEQSLDGLQQWVSSCREDPFQPVLDGGRERADGLQWAAELSRAQGPGDPELWGRAAQVWEGQERVHRAAYCWWRMAQAQVDQGQPSGRISPALQRAWELSAEMAPLRAAVEEIALRANVRLTTAPVAQDPSPVELPVSLTEREREILRHVAAGRSNSQIGMDLFISPKTVSVHVSNLLRKIGVANRVQAAAWAERVGLVQGAKSHGA
jgi:DNA-binding CsgD family transcriptional regulator/tetratricopeptide (TPR) repeat protein